jgi:hypothetical protein
MAPLDDQAVERLLADPAKPNPAEWFAAVADLCHQDMTPPQVEQLCDAVAVVYRRAWPEPVAVTAAMDAAYQLAGLSVHVASVAVFQGVIYEALRLDDAAVVAHVVNVLSSAAVETPALIQGLDDEQQLRRLSHWVLPGEDRTPDILVLLALICRPRRRRTLFSPILFDCTPIREFRPEAGAEQDGFYRLVACMINEVETVQAYRPERVEALTAWYSIHVEDALWTIWRGYSEAADFQEKEWRLTALSAIIAYAPQHLRDQLRDGPHGHDIAVALGKAMDSVEESRLVETAWRLLELDV